MNGISVSLCQRSLQVVPNIVSTICVTRDARLTVIAQKVHIGSMFLQNEEDQKWSFLIGARLDKHNLINHVIFSPRANVVSIRRKILTSVFLIQGFRAPGV